MCVWIVILQKEYDVLSIALFSRYLNYCFPLNVCFVYVKHFPMRHANDVCFSTYRIFTAKLIVITTEVIFYVFLLRNVNQSCEVKSLIERCMLMYSGVCFISYFCIRDAHFISMEILCFR